jgi:hypothetical protein
MKMKQSVDPATAAELQRLELALMDPKVRRDRNKVAALLDEEFLEFGASGRAWTREATLALLESENYTPPGVDEFSCSSLGSDAVLVNYRAIRIDERGARAVTLRSSIWIKQSGAWKMRFHQGTRAIE